MTRPIRTAWIHGIFYHKFNGLVYQKFPIDLWENLCDWISGKKQAYILEWTFGRILNYTNFNHPCPFFGYYYIFANNISIDHFVVEPLLPSGRYRIDVDFMYKQTDRLPENAFQIYFSVSDHRLEIIWNHLNIKTTTYKIRKSLEGSHLKIVLTLKRVNSVMELYWMLTCTSYKFKKRFLKTKLVILITHKSLMKHLVIENSIEFLWPRYSLKWFLALVFSTFSINFYFVT